MRRKLLTAAAEFREDPMEKILGCLLVFGLALPWFFTQRATGSVFAGWSAGLGGLLASVVVLLWLSVRRDRYRTVRQRRRDRRYAKSSMAAIDRMPGVEFEQFVAAQLRSGGWSVTHTAGSGDYGVDLIAARDHRRIAVQCKRMARAVGVAAVQQVVSGALHHGCRQAVVVTNRSFTKAAHQLAATHSCRLVGREQLHIWVWDAPASDPVRPHARRRLLPELEA